MDGSIEVQRFIQSYAALPERSRFERELQDLEVSPLMPLDETQTFIPLDEVEREGEPGLIKGIEVMKLGVIYKADPYLSLRSLPDMNSPVNAKLDFNTRVFVLRELPGDWYFIVTDIGKAGYIPKWTVILNPSDPLARLHKIKPGQSAIGIAEQYYKKDAQSWGSDLRFYINVLVYANGGDGDIRKGIYRAKGDDWKNAKTREGYFIWIPTVEYANQLKGIVKSGSISYEAWQKVKKIAYKVWNFIKFGAAFIAGLAHGIFDSLWGILVGFKDLAELLWSVIKSIFTGDIFSDAEELYNTVSKLDFKKIVLNWIKDFVSKWNDENCLKRGHFRGWVVGYAITEIIMTFISFGTLTGIKWVGKMSKFVEFIKETKLVKRILLKVDQAKGKITPVLETIKKTPKKLAKILSKTEALETLKAFETKYGDYILKGLGLSSSEGREAILKVLPSDWTADQLEDFVRKSQHLLAEKGKKQAGKILGWSLEEVEDSGFKGKVLEHMIQWYGKDALEDLNRKLFQNFPVVDAINNKTGHIISIARGTPEYLWDKVQVLFNVKITQAGIQSAKLTKYNNMLISLKRAGLIKDLSDFTRKARLLVPDHAVLPFKAIITKRVRDPILRERMLKAIISGF